MGRFPILSYPGAPTSGRNEVQRITGTPVISGGTWDMTVDGYDALTDIPWDVTASGLQALLDSSASPNVVVTGGPIATTPFTLTFQGAFGGLDRAQVTASAANLTGIGHALTPSTVTAGVKGTYRGAGQNSVLEDTTNGALYYQTGTPQTPVWSVAPAPVEWTLTGDFGTRTITSVL